MKIRFRGPVASLTSRVRDAGGMMAAFGHGFTAKHVGGQTRIFSHDGRHVGTLFAQHAFSSDADGNLFFSHLEHPLRRMTTGLRTADFGGASMDHVEHREQLHRCNQRNADFYQRVS